MSDYPDPYDLIDRICEVAKNRVAESKVTHPEDVAFALSLVADILADNAVITAWNT